MRNDKLFSEHERVRKTAERAAKAYAEFLKGSSKAREKDDEGNRRAQNKPVQREIGKRGK